MPEAIEVLLVEDNPGDVRLTQEVLKDGTISNNLSVVMDGVEAMAFLHRQGRYSDALKPDVIMLDLNLPKKDGREVLADIKADEDLKRIPVIILTTSGAEADVIKAYDLNANCFITKPVDLTQFEAVIRSIEGFWFDIVNLPKDVRA